MYFVLTGLAITALLFGEWGGGGGPISSMSILVKIWSSCTTMDALYIYVCSVNLVLVTYILNLYLTFSIPDVGWEDDIITNYNAVLSLQIKISTCQH